MLLFIGALGVLAGALTPGPWARTPPPATSEGLPGPEGVEIAPGHAPIRVSMESLHRTGGVPPGWRLDPGAGNAERGRRLFSHHGCHGCHAAGAIQPLRSEAGPDLSGMGAHHPPAYFAEAILSPSAVVVEGPGWTSPSGRSSMPSYPDLPLRDLSDLVAFLASLRGGGMAHHRDHTGHDITAAGKPSATHAPGAGPLFLLQRYEVRPGHEERFREWFRDDGAAAFLADPGILGVETFLDRTRAQTRVATVFTFRDEPSLRRFATDPQLQALGERFDSYIGAHEHEIFAAPPIEWQKELSVGR